MAENAQQKKKLYKSKTILANAIIGVAPFIPGVSEWIASNPSAFGVAVALLNLGLRSITGEPVTWKLIDRQL